MRVKSIHQKMNCPSCGLKDLHTQGLDQICLDCEWTNAKLLVDLGQLDQLSLAAHWQFEDPMSFEDLKRPENQERKDRVPRMSEAFG